MKKKYASLYLQLSNLSVRFSNLGLDFAKVAENLRESGVAPQIDLLDNIINARGDFLNLRTKVLEIANSISLPSIPKVDEIRSLRDISALLHTISEHEKYSGYQDIKECALKILEGILAISHSDKIDFEPLLECQATARELQNKVMSSQDEDLEPDIKSLSEGKNPFCDLLTLVEQRDVIDDGTWNSLQINVEKSFGKPLAIAASRGRLVVSKEQKKIVLTPEKRDAEIELSEIVQQPSPRQESEGLQEVTGEVMPFKIEGGGENIGVTAIKCEQHFEPPTVDHVESPGVPFKKSEESLISEQLSTREKEMATEDVKEEAKEKIEPLQIIYGFTPKDTAQKISATILGNSLEKDPNVLRDLIWRLIFEERLAIAFHIARFLQIISPNLHPYLPSWLLRALLLSQHVRYPSGDIAHLLKEDFANFSMDCFVKGSREWNHSVRLLLAASTLRPSLLAPNSQSSPILQSLRMKDGLAELYEYCQKVATYGSRCRALEPTALKEVKDRAVWKSETEQIVQEVKLWLSQAQLLKIHFGPAMKVWHKWFKPEGLVMSLLLPVKENNPDKLEIVKAKINQLSDETQIKKEVSHTDRKILKRLRGDEITAKSLGQILRHTKEATRLACRWVDLQESRPDQFKGNMQKETENLRQEIFSRQKKVLAELDEFQKSNYSFFITSSISCCKKAIQGIGSIFDPKEVISCIERDPKYLLNVEFLKIPNLYMDGQWEPEYLDYDMLLNEVLNLIASGDKSWGQVFEMRCNGRDHEATSRVIDYLEENSEIFPNLDELRANRDKHIRECKAALQRDVDATRKHISTAVALGLLKEQDHTKYKGDIDEIENSIQRTLRFSEQHERLLYVRKKIDEIQEAEIEYVRRRLNNLGIGQEHSSWKRINDVLERGDVLTANEYLDMVLKDVALPEIELPTDSFRNFFPKIFQDITEFLEPQPPLHRPDPKGIVEKIKTYAKGHVRTQFVGPIDMFRVSGPQAIQAAEMLDAWFVAKKAQKVYESSLNQILSGFGFNPTEIRIDKSGRRTWVDFTAEPIRDRNRCPVAAFGSNSNGRYRILCVWDRPTEEDLINDIGSVTIGPPIITFYFGRLTEQRRRDIAQLCRERRKMFIVIDDILVFYLCGERGTRLPVLLNCTLPFTVLEPYTITAGIVPPEMFYGRHRELESILNQDGSCFVYGGRQLGKTVLLREVERTFHNPKDGKIAIWIDLKAHGIGFDKSIDEIWNLMAQEFKKLGIMPSATPTHIGVDKLLEHVQNWTEGDSGRRILLLLDESDKFLEQDGKRGDEEKDQRGGEFIRAARLKGLMDRTNRRFKVVFAGLHNVQRTTRLENHPLAHYGEPICIGPLLDNGEWRDARDLIEKPLSSLGYRFESPDLITRILSQTNYYPNLIQLYCNQLLKHLNNPNMTSFDTKSCPPYIITSRHVEDAYQSQELRKAIRDRFMWTLDLDPRYRVIAFSIALYSNRKDGKDVTEGFSISWVRDQALTFWSAGFRENATEDFFRNLLDEMVGLGILRVVNPGYYALRSPNVISLIGTEQEIESELELSSERELAPGYEATTFRTGDKFEQWLRSPLTAQEESGLRGRKNGVSIIFGCEAAGLKNLEHFLLLAFGNEFFIKAKDVFDMQGFARLLDSLDKREKDGTTLLFIPSECPWSEPWVDESIHRITRLKSKNSFVRVVFTADPQATWHLLSKDIKASETYNSLGLTTITLKPWHDGAVWQWLEGLGFGPSDQKGRQKITKATGNWPALLYLFYELSKPELHRWEANLQKLENNYKDDKNIQDLLFSFGFYRNEPKRVLTSLAIYGEEASAEELVNLVEDLSLDIISRSLKWADLLNLVIPKGKECYCVNDLIGRVLLSGGK